MGVAARTVVKIIVRTPVTTAGGAGTASKDFKDPRERRPRGRPSAGPRGRQRSRWFVTPSPEQRLKRGAVNPEDKSWKAFLTASSAAAAVDLRSSREDFVHGLPV